MRLEGLGKFKLNLKKGAAFFLGLLVDSEDGDDMFIRNVG
jgi:hypothetical protein